MPAIYYQIITAAKEEFAIVEKCIVRERCMQDLKDLIQSMDSTKDAPTESQLLSTFKLFISVRQCTVDLLKAIGIWQSCFTKLRRPQLMEKDYLVGMISDSDYFSNSKARKHFNFMIGRGNILILPRANANKKPDIQISEKLAELIELFVNPDPIDIRSSYQVMINSLSVKQFNQLYPAKGWLLNESWVSILFNCTFNFSLAHKV